MDQVLYYVPGVSVVGQAGREAAGVAHLLRANAPEGIIANNGPDGGAGVVLHNLDGLRLGYFPERQRWTVEPEGRYWVGVEGSPRPDVLLRPETLTGHHVKLEDGHLWMVPLARVFGVGTTIPNTLALGPDGALVRNVLPRFVEFSRIAERLERQYFGEVEAAVAEGEPESGAVRPGGWTEEEAYRMAGEALGLNYYVDAFVVGCMGLITSTNLLRILEAVIDIPTFRVAAQRQEAGAEGKAPGEPLTPGGDGI